MSKHLNYMDKKWPCLAKPPVITAIFQLRFDNGSLKVDDYLSFDAILKRHFPKRNESFESNLSFSPATKITIGKNQVSGITDTRRTGYVYYTTDQKEKVSLSETEITYTTERPYEGWDHFKEKVFAILSAVSPVLESVTIRRTSIRFINQFRFNEFSDPTLYFNTQISSVGGGMPFSLIRYGFKLTYDIEEGVYSIVNQSVEHLPDKYVYIFDIDVLNRNNLIFELNTLGEMLESLRSVKNQIFFGNLTDKTLEQCN